MFEADSLVMSVSVEIQHTAQGCRADVHVVFTSVSIYRRMQNESPLSFHIVYNKI